MTADVALAKGASTLRQEGLLLDYTIEVGDEQFRVHKVVMASVSDYFKAMLTGGMVESREDSVRLEGLSAVAVADIIDFIYTNQLAEQSLLGLKELMDCAFYLQVPSAIEKCTIELCHQVKANNCFDVLSVFTSFSLYDGIKYTMEYIKSNITSVLLNCGEGGMSHDQLLTLINCWEWSEAFLFDVIKQWISADYENRKEHVNHLMTHVRFCLMERSELETMKLADIFLDSDGPWRDLVEKALAYHKLPTHRQVLHDSEQTRIRSEPTAVCFLADGRPEFPIHALDKWISWQPYDVPAAPAFDRWPIYVLEVNNFLIVYEEDWQWNIFNPRTLAWSRMDELEADKRKFTLVHHEKHLFVLGGVRTDSHVASDTTEKYNFDTDTWQVLTSKLPIPVLGASAFSIAGSIYISGGRNSLTTDARSARLDCFHPTSGTWQTKAPMLEAKPDSEIQVLELFREKIIIVLDKEFTLQYYKPSTDQWSVWRKVGASLSSLTWDDRREDANKMVVRGDSVFMLNFRKGNGGGACEMWTFFEKGLEKVEKIGQLPFKPFNGDHGGSVFSFSALLRLQQKPTSF